MGIGTFIGFAGGGISGTTIDGIALVDIVLIFGTALRKMSLLFLLHNNYWSTGSDDIANIFVFYYREVL